ncbi:MAG: biotin--[acetyl-CoA-carboxylase] ligase [Cryobacterium sp.]|nr:biotin--[acetyl-CoA-carboxylase] ligase [Cryobacterium sp.]
MEFELTRQNFPALIVLDEVDSTNDELLRRFGAGGLADFSVVTTMNQTAGHGRLDRGWITPVGKGLATSVYIRFESIVDNSRLRHQVGWVSLLAGFAMVRAINPFLKSVDLKAFLKWPNDVLVDGKKICGVLGRVLDDNSGLIVGAGLNLTSEKSDLPFSTSTSLAQLGVTGNSIELADEVLLRYLLELRDGISRLAGSNSDDVASLKSEISETCATLGERVRVQNPDGTEDLARAQALDDSGGLVVRLDSGLKSKVISAGDIVHLRYE